MRSNYIDRLSEWSLKGDDVESEARSALGLALPNLRLLERAILDDLRETPSVRHILVGFKHGTGASDSYQ